MLLGNQGRHIPCNFIDGCIPVRERFCKEILKIIYQGGLYVLMGVNGFPLIQDKMRDLIGVPPLDDSSVKEFSVAFPFLEPLDA